MEKIKLRELKASDVFLMTKIMSKIGINEFSDCFQKAEIRKLVADAVTKKAELTEDENINNEHVENSEDLSLVVGAGVALEMANIILKNIDKCENEIYKMLANLSNKEVEEIKNLKFVVFSELIIDFVTKEEFKDFMKVVSKFLKK